MATEFAPEPHKQQDGIKFYIEDGTDTRLTRHDPDCLVDMASDILSAILRHPQPYERQVLGTKVYVVDDAAYESIFYFFAGKTMRQMYDDDKTSAALFLGRPSQPVLSMKLYQDAQDRERGY